MKLVLLSGGSGQRLWPMSNESRSKQFMKVLPGEDGNSISMLQRVWHQLGTVGLQDSTFICASRAQADMIFHQVGDVPFIEEPLRMDTFPAIALATTYLLDVAGIDEDESIAIVPVDHFVENRYFQEILQLDSVLRESEADLVLMGVEPEAPTSKFGYISVHPYSEGAPWRQVKAFVEKPDTFRAETLISQGALWNCGVFCFTARFLQNLLKERRLPASYLELRAQFPELPKRSFDYEVVEKTESTVVIPYRGTWKDLGTWSSLSEEMAFDVAGLGTARDCENTHVINELGIPVVSLGIKDAVVVATPDGVLVTDKEHSARLKDVIQPYQSRPMYEERRWGTYRVLDYQKLSDGTEVLTKSIELYSNHNISYQKHMKRSEIWTIVEGYGTMVLDNRSFPVSAGDVIRIYAEQWHAIQATETLKFIEVQRGSELVEEDIVRRYLTWDEIEEACSFGVRREGSVLRP